MTGLRNLSRISCGVSGAVLLCSLGCSAGEPSANGNELEDDGNSSAASAGSSSDPVGATGGTAPASGGNTGSGSGGDMGSGSGGEPGGGTGGAGELPPVEECAEPSIDRIKDWKASGKGVGTEPLTGTMLQMDGDKYVARGRFIGDKGHFIVSLANQWNGEVDLSEEAGFTLTYSATADFQIHLRPFFDWSGGNKWNIAIPSTGGNVETVFFPFDPAVWFRNQVFPTAPPHTLLEGLAGATAFFISSTGDNDMTFYGLRIGSYVPDCDL